MEMLNTFVHNLATKKDPRTKDMPVLTNPYFVAGAVALYLFISRNGERWMKNRQAFNCYQVIRWYNVFMVISNFAFFLYALEHTYLGGGYSLFCQGLSGRSDPSFMWALNMGWYYLIVRYFDLFDTFFFILRKKFNQVTNLHVIHHALVVINGSFWFLYAPEGQPAAGVLFNSFIHVLMYSYYFMATFAPLRPYLWWKRHLTMLQIGQFVFFICHMSIPLFYDCGFPRYLVHFAIAQTILILGLFVNFYIKAYITKDEQKRHLRIKVDVNGNLYDNVNNNGLKKD